VLSARALAAADSLTIQPLAPGVWYVRSWDASGPWAIHVLEIDTSRCAPGWSARKPDGPLTARATTSSLAGGALAGSNADFFTIPAGTPVGPQVSGGRVLIGPGDRPVWLWDGQHMAAGQALLVGETWTVGDTVALAQLNRAVHTTTSYTPPPSGAALFTPLAPRIPPADSGADVVLLSATTGDERAGEGRVLRVVRAGTDTLSLGAGEAALQLWGAARAWSGRRVPGELVQWHATLRPADQTWSAREALGGFPMLLRDNRDVLAGTSVTTSFAQRHPRTAIGWSSRTGRAFLVAVDGRQAPYSDGMTLTELLALFRRLGATDALNLDGGGSTTLVIRGQIQNRPSDSEGERPVGNALVLDTCLPGSAAGPSR